MKKKKDSNIENKYYVEIDKNALESSGEIKIISDPINAAVQLQKVPRGGFEIVYTSALLELFGKLGGKKYTVLQYLLKHRDSMNCLNMSNSELAKACNVCRCTVVETMKVLLDAGAVVRKGSVIIFSPSIMVKGDKSREAYIMRKFIEAKEDEDTQE